MRTLVVLVFLLLTPGAASAFEGRIVTSEGKPVAGGEVTILGHTGVARTDADGRFTWTPDPPPPFEILVIAPGGVYMKPVLVEHLAGSGIEITVTPLVSEVVTVSGSAGSIETTPASGTATLTAREIQTRTPANLVQALENVAGVSQVSEGQAAVPAVRGLARGRTLILVDGARVSSERRVGASATYLDPGVIEGIEVARGPGSVAYGSDAFGGVISVRTRTAAPSSPFAVRVGGTVGAGIPDRRASLEIARGFARGGAIARRAHARRRRLRRARRRNFQFRVLRPRLSRARDTPGCGRISVRWVAERLWSRHRTPARQLAGCPFLLSERGLTPVDGRLRPT